MFIALLAQEGVPQSYSRVGLTLVLPRDAVPGQPWLRAGAGTGPIPVWAQARGGGIQLGTGWGRQFPTASTEAMMAKGWGHYRPPSCN